VSSQWAEHSFSRSLPAAANLGALQKALKGKFAGTGAKKSKKLGRTRHAAPLASAIAPTDARKRRAHLIGVLETYRRMQRRGGAILSIDFEGFRTNTFTETGFVMRQWSGTADPDIDLVARASAHFRAAPSYGSCLASY
jgi:hypothetical protein